MIIVCRYLYGGKDEMRLERSDAQRCRIAVLVLLGRAWFLFDRDGTMPEAPLRI